MGAAAVHIKTRRIEGGPTRDSLVPTGLRRSGGRRGGVLRGSMMRSCVALLLCAVCGLARAGDFEDMIAAERAFAADAAAHGTRDAFLAALASDALVFQPGPTSGQRAWTARKPDKNLLEWTPALAGISASGDLGYTVGPWRFTQDGAKAPVATGWFFTLWRKQPDGKWKVLIDHGIVAPASEFPATVQRRGGVGVGMAPDWPVGLRELRSADLVPAGQLDPRIVAGDFLRLRAGQAPDGRAEGAALPSTATRLDTGAVVSSAGDLAATWGGGPGSPAWIRVWRRPTAEDAPGHGWTLAVDFAVAAVAVRSSDEDADEDGEPAAMAAPAVAAPAVATPAQPALRTQPSAPVPPVPPVPAAGSKP
jgi:ketosteroid isomerase-like protein